MKVSVLRYAAIGMATLSLAGFAAAATNVDMSNTGPDSNNHVRVHNNLNVSQRNHNDVGVGNISLQSAETGNVRAHENTTVTGGVQSGDAQNSNAADTSVSISNHSSSLSLGDLSAPESQVTMDTTGPDSDNRVNINNSARLTQNNDNNVEVLNFNAQEAESGNVNASDNTTVGGLKSGAASNDNTTKTTVGIQN